MKRKQLTALLLSAAMVLTNAGISFGALDGPEDVGERKEVVEGKEVWITLNANGGMFRFAGSEEPDTPGVSTPSDASPSNASKAAVGEKTSTSLDVGGPVTIKDKDGYYYLLFEDAKPVEESAVSGWDVLTEGPETKNGEMEFAGWYAKKDDLATKLEPESKLYGHADVYARWVSNSQANVDSSVANQVQNVQVSGLAEGNKLTFAALDDTKDVQFLTEIVDKRALTDLGVSSVELSKDENALVQLDISVDQTTKGPVGITMKDPFDGKYDKVLVIHLNDAATEALDVQYAVLDGENLSFTAKGFSPYILAAVDSVTGVPAKIKVKNVKNGALFVYSETEVEGGVKRTFVPIDEEVEIPVGTVLYVEYQGLYIDNSYWRPKDNKVQITSGEETTDIQIREPYRVSGDAVISAEFAEEKDGVLDVTPRFIPAPAVYEGKVSYYDVEDDGTKTYRQLSLAEDGKNSDNSRFTLKDGLLKSRETLPLGQYTVEVEYTGSEGYTESRRFTLWVGDIRIDEQSYELPKPGSFEALLKVYSWENHQWTAQTKWSVEMDSERNYGDNDKFVLENNNLKSNGPLELGVYYPNVIVKTPEGGSYKNSISINVGIDSTFGVLLGSYEFTHGEDKYAGQIEMYVGGARTEKGIKFADAKALAFENAYVKEIAMYGNHTFKGWADESGKIVEDAQELEKNNEFYAVFEGYTPVKVETTASSEDPKDPEKPEEPNKPDKPGDSGNSSSRDEDYSSGSSSSGGKGSSTEANTISGNWQKDAKGWWFQMANGGYARNQWGKVNNVWYYFNNEGYMATGWQQVDGRWYYLSEAEANLGTLIVGWHFDSNYQKWFYLNSSGIMLTGWQQIDGNWYYLNMSSDGIQGAMAANTTVDGYYINANGVRAQ